MRNILLALLVLPTFGIWAKSLKFTNLKCTVVDPKFASFTVCEMKAVKRFVSEISITVKLLEPPVTNATVKLELLKRGQQRAKSVLGFSIDYCQFWSNANGRRNPTAIFFYDFFGMMKYSNLNHSCPYDHDLTLHRFRIDKNKLSTFPFLSNGAYTLRSFWNGNHALRVIVEWNFDWSNTAD